MSGLSIFASLNSVLGRHERMTIGALALITLVAAIYTVMGIGMDMSAWEMTGMPSDMPMPVHAWSAIDAFMMFLMWWIMMIAMMLPSAAPMILLYLRVGQRRDQRVNSPSPGYFCFGYLAMWGAFSLGATLLHAVGEQVHVINGMMAITGHGIAGSIFILAGLWQFFPLKSRCLEACRQPVQFLSKIWASGRMGALRMGLCHGLFCVGCCWAMMLLLFVGGVMNLYWIAGLAVLALIEKIASRWRYTPHAIGSGFMMMGGLMLV